ncbi:LuxR family transcriptional regulator [Kitasatospora sp. NA04385]|uniref:LuxR C-terminal-related transcriptional regulator n=1 Tax=Kitasatospora sp. NA04385 TaxID=2742135 RepID=UPI001590A523|nr:LuxR C-terminal-related transcriptional regulator [Kitasatospora sp. NA04385]QKW20680.1 LuxR family transcriptional regulator [Kitasatospora sp. NA04385]
MADPIPTHAAPPVPASAAAVSASAASAAVAAAVAAAAATGCGPLDERAWRLYLDVLEAGGRIAAEAVPAAYVAARASHAARAAHAADPGRGPLAELLRTGLLVSDGMDGSYLAVDPRFVADTLGTEMNAEATRLLNRAERLAADLDPLIAAYDSVPRPSGPGSADVQVTGREHIRQRIAQLGAACREEALTAQPGHAVPAALELSLRQELPLLRRGCRILTLYQPTALAEPAVIRYAATVTEAGGEVRLLDEPFQRALVFDRATAVVPASDDLGRAAVLSDPATVAMIVANFDRDWARAERVCWNTLLDSTPTRPAAADRIGRLLAQGLTQKAIATRLGLSERTVAGHISRLRDLYGAETLFQLGWLMRDGGHRA